MEMVVVINILKSLHLISEIIKKEMLGFPTNGKRLCQKPRKLFLRIQNCDKAVVEL